MQLRGAVNSNDELALDVRSLTRPGDQRVGVDLGGGALVREPVGVTDLEVHP